MNILKKSTTEFIINNTDNEFNHEIINQYEMEVILSKKEFNILDPIIINCKKTGFFKTYMPEDKSFKIIVELLFKEDLSDLDKFVSLDVNINLEKISFQLEYDPDFEGNNYDSRKITANLTKLQRDYLKIVFI
jgi:hypothetical protein